MSSYTEFAEKMLIALYQETERTEKDMYTFGELIDRYGIESKESWIQRLADDWEHVYAREVTRFLGTTARDWDVAISGHGMRYVEDKYGGKDGVGTYLDPVAEEIASEPVADVLEQPLPEAIHSEGWTGVTSQIISSGNSDRIRSAILKAKDSVRDLGSNEKTAQAIAFLNAAEALTDAPDPPSDIIWELISRAGAVCGIIGLFITLFMVS